MKNPYAILLMMVLSIVFLYFMAIGMMGFQHGWTRIQQISFFLFTFGWVSLPTILLYYFYQVLQQETRDLTNKNLKESQEIRSRLKTILDEETKKFNSK